MDLCVVYDACVLFPAPLRDLLMRVAHAGLVRARWSDNILDECFRNILIVRPELDPQVLARTRQLMNAAVADCLVDGYEPLVEGLELPDPNDRHVLAAAIHGGASVIVTMNLRDFPERFLVPHAVEVRATAKTVRTWVVGTLPTGAPAHLARQFAGWVCDIDGGLGGS